MKGNRELHSGTIRSCKQRTMSRNQTLTGTSLSSSSSMRSSQSPASIRRRGRLPTRSVKRPSDRAPSAKRWSPTRPEAVSSWSPSLSRAAAHPSAVKHTAMASAQRLSRTSPSGERVSQPLPVMPQATARPLAPISLADASAVASNAPANVTRETHHRCRERRTIAMTNLWPGDCRNHFLYDSGNTTDQAIPLTQRLT